MAQQNINSSYLNSDAVANYMQAADLSIGDANGQLSSNELSQFMNQNIVTWVNPPSLTTVDQINTEVLHLLPLHTADNLAHFQVYYILGVYLLITSQRQDLTVTVTYDQLVTRFNQTYGDANADAMPPTANAAAMPPMPPTAEEEEEECPICYESYNVNAPYNITLPCNRHKVCARDILQLCARGQNAMKCPICRAPFNEAICQQAQQHIAEQPAAGGRRRRKRKGSKSRKARKSRKSRKSRKAKK